MTHPQTLRLNPDTRGIGRAAQILSDGGLVAFPTETVYGLGADARQDTAVAEIFNAKGRPQFNPLIVHVLDLAEAQKYVLFNDIALHLAAAFWPGPLTLVLPLKVDSGISQLTTTGLETLGVRVPSHPVARQVLQAFGGPVAAPSANPSGKISPTNAAHVLAGLDGRIDAVLDGSETDVGLESTIVRCVDKPVLLREGGVPADRLETVLGFPLVQSLDAARPEAPGQLSSHYAPRGKVRLNALFAKKGEVLLGFGPVEAALNLSPSSDLAEAAANLFAFLHKLDAMGAEQIAVSPIPNIGLGRAINDRLRRAAAPR